MEPFYDGEDVEALRPHWTDAQRQAVNALHEAGFQGDGAQNWAQLQKHEYANSLTD